MTDPRKRRLAEALHRAMLGVLRDQDRGSCLFAEDANAIATRLFVDAPDLFASPPPVDPGLREAAQAFVSHMDGPEPRHGLWATLKADREAIRAALSHPDEDTQDRER